MLPEGPRLGGTEGEPCGGWCPAPRQLCRLQGAGVQVLETGDRGAGVAAGPCRPLEVCQSGRQSPCRRCRERSPGWGCLPAGKLTSWGSPTMRGMVGNDLPELQPRLPRAARSRGVSRAGSRAPTWAPVWDTEPLRVLLSSQGASAHLASPQRCEGPSWGPRLHRGRGCSALQVVSVGQAKARPAPRRCRRLGASGVPSSLRLGVRRRVPWERQMQEGGGGP